MQLVVTSPEQLAAALAKAGSNGEKIEHIDLRQLNCVIEHTPEDLTVSVEAGIHLATLQGRLRDRGQWLPIDPPNPENITIWDLLRFNLSGPRRYGNGTIREHLIGLKVALADGRIIKSGGKVVKNVAGYDLLKLFVGDRGTLGVAIEANFKVQPLPAREQFVRRAFGTIGETAQLLESIIASPLTPSVLDLHGDRQSLQMVVGFAGTNEEVEWLLSEAAALGFRDPASLDYDTAFWAGNDEPSKVSVLPSRVVDTLQHLQPESFVCRAGNGVIFYRGGTESQAVRSVPLGLVKRLKDTFDPKHVLPDPTL